MKKIIAFIGSRANTSSLTYKFTKLMLDKLAAINNDMSYEIITPNNYKINHCLSCNKCFFTGKCVQDNIDDMNIIKEKILECDLIILGSPVFAHNVSGDMKTFIDRISYWLHIFRLANKKSITISTSISNGNIYVNNYLSHILRAMGAENILDIEFTSLSLNDIDFLESESLNYANIIYDELNKSSICNSNELQEKEFTSLKEIISNYDEDNAEYIYWKTSKLMDCNTYQEYLLNQ